MSNRNLFASTVMACLLAVGLAGLAPTANAASAGQSLQNVAESARNDVTEVGYRRRGVTIELPIGPSYTYYDYQYYYSRGYYPTHMGNYVYYNPKNYNPDYAEHDGAPYSAKERCDRRYRSFEWDTGLYTTYSGYKRLCPYLR